MLMAAEAIELLHGASLFHDDIMDHAAERRGMASLHEQLGVAQALVIGDDLLLRAFAALADASPRHSPEVVLQAMQALNQLARTCCRGQFEELRATRWISEEQYFAIVEGKTASPFIAAGVLGVLLGGGTQSQLAQIRIYAREMGIAFQIHDDLLDLVGEPGSMGKPVGNSLSQGRPDASAYLPVAGELRSRSLEVARAWSRRMQSRRIARPAPAARHTRPHEASPHPAS